jgi:hypothetical protein
MDTTRQTAEEYADEVIASFDPEWHGTDDHIAFVTDEVVGFISRTAEIAKRHVDRTSVQAMVERRLAAQQK